MTVQVRDLGRMEYGACLALQRQLVASRQRGEGEDTILLVEHPPVATLGRRGEPGDVFDPALPVFSIERGGKATYHGPGQLVVYPIVHLGEGNRDIRAWVQHIEAFAVRLLAGFGVAAHARTDQPGVWTAGGKKIGSVGIAVQHWVSFHGLALNIDMDLREFDRLNPCGLGSGVMTSLRAEGSAATLADVRAAAAKLAADHFNTFQIESNHQQISAFS
jgi:lipoyl(octanoyl) transferase